ncbi:MAG: hypothetical protein ABSE95_17095 [Thermodesulfobacteriota bacterium]
MPYEIFCTVVLNFAETAARCSCNKGTHYNQRFLRQKGSKGDTWLRWEKYLS